MKKSLLIALTAIMSLGLVLSCKKADKITGKEASLSLKAPSGQQIAPTIALLRTDALRIITKKFGSGKEFEITGIHYLPVTKGYAAVISYRLSTGETGNFASFSGIRFSISSQSITTDYATAAHLSNARVAPDGGKITITCTRTGSCECLVEGTVNMNTGVITWKCSCEQCTATVTYG